MIIKMALNEVSGRGESQPSHTALQIFIPKQKIRGNFSKKKPANWSVKEIAYEPDF